MYFWVCICQGGQQWWLASSARNLSWCVVESCHHLSSWSWQQSCDLEKEWRAASSGLHKGCSFSLFLKGVGAHGNYWRSWMFLLVLRTVIRMFFSSKAQLSAVFILGGWKDPEGFLMLPCGSRSMNLQSKNQLFRITEALFIAGLHSYCLLYKCVLQERFL